MGVSLVALSSDSVVYLCALLITLVFLMVSSHQLFLDRKFNNQQVAQTHSHTHTHTHINRQVLQTCWFKVLVVVHVLTVVICAFRFMGVQPLVCLVLERLVSKGMTTCPA